MITIDMILNEHICLCGNKMTDYDGALVCRSCYFEVIYDSGHQIDILLPPDLDKIHITIGVVFRQNNCNLYIHFRDYAYSQFPLRFTITKEEFNLWLNDIDLLVREIQKRLMLQ